MLKILSNNKILKQTQKDFSARVFLQSLLKSSVAQQIEVGKTLNNSVTFYLDAHQNSK